MTRSARSCLSCPHRRGKPTVKGWGFESIHRPELDFFSVFKKSGEVDCEEVSTFPRAWRNRLPLLGLLSTTKL